MYYPVVNEVRAGAARTARTRQGKRSGKLLEGFFRVAGRLHAALDAGLGEVGLSVPTFLALKNLVEVGKPLPLGQLAARTHCGKSHMTQLVDRLEMEGLVARRPDPQDRRSVLATLSEEGERRYAAGIKVVGRVEEQFFGRLGSRERAAFLDCLDRLLKD